MIFMLLFTHKDRFVHQVQVSNLNKDVLFLHISSVIFSSQLTFVHLKFAKPALKTWVILYRGGKNLETLVTYLYKELNKEQALLFLFSGQYVVYI